MTDRRLPATERGGRLHRLARDPVGRVAGAILALALIATPFAYMYGRSEPAARAQPSFVEPVSGQSSSPATAPPAASSPAPPTSTPAIDAEIEGNCNAVGTGNTVTCGRLSIDNVEISDAQAYFLWFDGPPSDLPTPPAVESNLTYPCGDWYPWLRSQPGFYFEGPSKDIILTAGEPDVVTLMDVKLLITKRTARPAGDGTYVQCNWGGGSHETYNIYVDTLKNRTTIRTDGPDGEGPEQRMPPAAIALGDLQSAGANVRARSAPGHIYEGILQVTASRNGKLETMRVGSAAEPLRWIAAGSQVVDPQTAYGWDPQAARWVQGFNPFGGGADE